MVSFDKLCDNLKRLSAFAASVGMSAVYPLMHFTIVTSGGRDEVGVLTRLGARHVPDFELNDREAVIYDLCVHVCVCVVCCV